MRIIKRPNIFSAFSRGACLAMAVAFGIPAVAGELPELDCVLEPSNLIEVSSAVEGVIENIYVDRNDAVTKNQLLVELDSDVERSQVALASARAASNTNILLRETASKFEQRKKTRIGALYDTNAVPLHLKDESLTDARKSRLQLKKAIEDKQLAELELARAKAILRLRSMRSPIDGVVIARHKVPGEFVEDQAILMIAQLDPLFVELIAPVELFGSIAPGMRVEVSPEIAGFGRQFATVTMVDRVIHAASGTFDVRAELSNPDNRIPSGLRCTSRFIFETPNVDAIAEADIDQDEETAALEPDSEQALKLARSEAPQSKSDPLDEL